MSSPDAQREFFTPDLEATFRAIAVCILPPEPDSPGGDADEAIAHVDRQLAGRSPQDRKLLATFLKAVERMPVVRYGRRFSSLDTQRRARVLRFLQNNAVSKLRQGFFGVKTFVLMGYYALPEVWDELGYPGPRLDAPYYQLRAKARGARSEKEAAT